MSDRCQKCGTKFVRYPIKDENGKFIIKNFFKMDMMSILFLLCVVFMIFGYVNDIKEYKDISESPCEFCKETKCCLVMNEFNDDNEEYIIPSNFSFNINK
jgi:hypothetical protein